MAQYITIAEGTAIFLRVMNADAWDDAATASKTKAILASTDIIDRLNYEGEKADEDQVLQFPRDADTVVPDDIKTACAHIALALLDDIDMEIEFDNLSMVSQGISSIRATYRTDRVAEHIVAGVPSIIAWRYLKPFLRDSNSVSVNRVS